MFQFTTTTIINDSKWEGKLDSRWSFQEADEDKNIPASANIKGVGIFNAPNITSAFKAEGFEGQIGKFSFTMPSKNVDKTDLKKGDILHLSFVIALSQIDNDALYANDYAYKGKRFFIDFPYKGTPADTAAYLEEMVKKSGLNIYSRKLWELKATGSTVEVTGVVPTQRFRNVYIEKLDDTAEYYRDHYTDLDVDVTYVDGVDHFLTYDWMIANLRLPTWAHTRFGAEHEHENPIKGVIYDQYTLHYCKNSSVLGTGNVGQPTKATTTHVFFLPQGELSSKFETLLNKVLADTDVTLETVKAKDSETEIEP